MKTFNVDKSRQLGVFAVIAVLTPLAACSSSVAPSQTASLGGPAAAQNIAPSRPIAADRQTALASQHGAAPVPKGSIVVADGDTLLSISRRHRVPISLLMRANGLQRLKVQPGTQLVIPKV